MGGYIIHEIDSGESNIASATVKVWWLY